MVNKKDSIHKTNKNLFNFQLFARIRFLLIIPLQVKLIWMIKIKIKVIYLSVEFNKSTKTNKIARKNEIFLKAQTLITKAEIWFFMLLKI